MARTGWSASNYLLYAGVIVSAVPFTVAAWARTSVTGVTQQIFCIDKIGDTTQRFSMTCDSGAKVEALATDTGTPSAAITTNNFTANTWFHACGVWASATDRRAFLDGGSKGTQSTSVTPAALDRTTIGFLIGGSSPWGNGGTGDLAEVAIYNIALSDADVASLAVGVSPLLIHPEALVAYWPILGAYSPENNLKSNTTTMAIQGTLTQSAHTRVFMPSQRRITVAQVAAPPPPSQGSLTRGGALTKGILLRGGRLAA